MDISFASYIDISVFILDKSLNYREKFLFVNLLICILLDYIIHY
jgi:hypothetical protein